MDDDLRFAGRRGGKKTGEKRKRTKDTREEKIVIVRMNGRTESSSNALIIAMHKLEDHTLTGVKKYIGNRLYGGNPCPALYHDDGIVVANIDLFKDNECIYGTHTVGEIFMGCTPDNVVQFEPKAAPGAEEPGSNVDVTKTELVVNGILNSTEEHIDAEAFHGEKDGYFFGTMHGKLGYHKDHWGIDSAEKPHLVDLLSVYGGGDYLGKSRNVHGLNQKAEPRLSSTSTVLSARKEVSNTVPQGPNSARIEKEREEREAKLARKTELDSELKKVSTDGASTQRSMLSALAAMVKQEAKRDEKERRADLYGGGGGGAGASGEQTFVSFKSKEKVKETREKNEAAKKLADSMLNVQGLAEKEEQDQDKREKQSKRARRRAKKRDENE